MTCLKAQSLITPFINDKLSLKELEEFLDHIRSCSECREELEVYFTLLTAMKQLNEDRSLSDDFGLELAEKLEQTQEKIIHTKYVFYRKKGFLIIIIMVMTLFFSMQHYLMEQERINPVTESNFILRTSYHQRQYEKMKMIVDQKLEEQAQELLEIQKQERRIP